MSMQTMRQMTVRFLACLLLCVLIPLSVLAETGTVVNTANLRLRSGTSTSSDIIGEIPKGDKVEIISTHGDWYKVKYKKRTGYVMSKFIKKGSSSSGNTSSAKYTDKPTCTTLKPGAKGDNVRRLQTRLKSLGFYSGEINGTYDNTTKNAVIKFQRKKGLYADGIVGTQTMEKLYPASQFGGKAAEKLVTEKLDWFDGNAYRIPKGAVVEVKDCLTGRVFKAKRWSGYNHMDTEPLTKDDTAIMLSCYGGTWSWRRRPVLVKYNGHVYAGSMNGMPHGTSTIANNFDGHFCIHFSGSMTHGSKKVDPDHQNCVRKALKYKW